MSTNPETEAAMNTSAFVPFTVHSSTAIPTTNVTVKIDKSIIHSDLPRSYSPLPFNFNKKRVKRKYKNFVKNRTISLAVPFPDISSSIFKDNTFSKIISTVVFIKSMDIQLINTTNTFLYMFPLRKITLYATSTINITRTEATSISVSKGHMIPSAKSSKKHIAVFAILYLSFFKPIKRVKNSAIIIHSTALAAISETIILAPP